MIKNAVLLTMMLFVHTELYSAPMLPRPEQGSLQELRDQVPEACRTQCRLEEKPWIGKIILPGEEKAVDYQNADITEPLNYYCACRNRQASTNRDALYNNTHAAAECPKRCEKEVDKVTKLPGMIWTGAWWSLDTIPSSSVCLCASSMPN